MASTDKALLANLDVYVAEGNVRNGVIRFASNMLSRSPNKEFKESRLLLGPETSTIFDCVPSNSATILRTSKPITLTFSIETGVTSTIVVESLLVLTTPVLSDAIEIANLSTTDSAKIQLLHI